MARRAAAAYLIALFALSVYRAVTQSFTTDEIYSYNLYVGAKPFNLLHQYDANLHFLHTLATWATVKLLGMSEFTFRLPSLVGCALYLAAVYRLAKQTTLLAVLLLTAHPLLQDHMSVGRGYGLALAFFAWAFVEAISDAPRLTRVAILLALSVGTNFTFLFPACALVGTLILQRRDLLLTQLSGPWMVFTALLLVVPLSRMQPGALYFGAATILASLQSLNEPGVIPESAIGAVCGAILVACALAAYWQHRFAAKQFGFISTATLALTSVAVLASHYGFGMPLPYARTGLYFLFLVPLCLLPLAGRMPYAFVLGAFALYLGSHIDPRIYGEWAFDASAKDILRTIESQHKATDPPVRISTSAPMATVLRHYRGTLGLSWITVIEQNHWQPDFDYYVLRGGDFNQIQLLGLKEESWDVLTGVKVATP